MKTKCFINYPICSKNLNKSMNTESSGSSWCETFEQFLVAARVKEISNLGKTNGKEHYFKSRIK